MSGVTDRFTPEGQAFMRALKELGDTEVFIGFQRGEQHKKKKSSKSEKEPPDVLDIALWNEMGTSNGIPERPFIRQTFDNHAEDIAATQKAVVQRVMNGATPQEAASVVGAKVKALMQREIAEGGFTANKPETIKRKGSDVPLIDTGHMRQSVQFIVRKKGSGGD